MNKKSRKKSYLFSGPATKRGEGGKGWATKKNNFFFNSKKIRQKNVATKLEGGWVKALVAGH